MGRSPRTRDQRRGITPVHAEITYINHIVAPAGHGPYRLHDVLAVAQPASTTSLGDASIEGALRFLDHGSDIALRAFVDLTTPSIQRHWGRRD